MTQPQRRGGAGRGRSQARQTALTLGVATETNSTHQADSRQSSGQLEASWTLRLPGHPPSQNDRLHWAARARLTKWWRWAVRVEARKQDIPWLERASITLIVQRPRLGVADPDNDLGRLKPLIDGLRDAGVLTNDRYTDVVVGEVREERGPKMVTLIVAPIEATRQAAATAGEGREG